MAEHAPTTPATLARRKHVRATPGAMDRRYILGGLLCAGASFARTASAGVATGQVRSGPPESPDADLIAACTEYLRIQRAFDAYCCSMPEDVDIGPDDPGLAMLDPIPALVECIVALPAITADGHLARARCYAIPYRPKFPDCRDDTKAGDGDRFRAAMLRDLVQMERGVGA